MTEQIEHCLIIFYTPQKWSSCAAAAIGNLFNGCLRPWHLDLGPNHDLTGGCPLELEEVWACTSLLSRPGGPGTHKPKYNEFSLNC